MTKEEWKGLSKKAQWDVLVSLRGPDIKGSETLKHFTTGVIRKAMSNLIRVGGQLSDLGFVVVPTPGMNVFYGVGGPVRVDLDHFALHTYEAAEILGVPIVCVPGDVWEAMVVSGGTSKAMILFCGWAQEHTHQINGSLWSSHIKGLIDYYGPGEKYNLHLAPPAPSVAKLAKTKSSLKQASDQYMKNTTPASQAISGWYSGEVPSDPQYDYDSGAKGDQA